MIKRVISEYGGAVGILIAIVLIIGICSIIIGTDASSVLGKALSDLIHNAQSLITP